MLTPNASVADLAIERAEACYFSSQTDEARYACLWSGLETCKDTGNSGLVACIQKETSAWQSLMDTEAARISNILQTQEISEGPCKGNEDGCLLGLQQLLSDGASYAEQKCTTEASPKHNAGHPDLAMASCMVRETSRQTIRVRQFGDRMGRYTP